MKKSEAEDWEWRILAKMCGFWGGLNWRHMVEITEVPGEEKTYDVVMDVEGNRRTAQVVLQ